MSRPSRLYIPVYTNLPDHPKTRRLAKALNLDVTTTIGHLVRLWLWAQEYAGDGHLDPFGCDEIAWASGYQEDAERFIFALQETGFLDDRFLHDWDVYAGKVQQQRQHNAERQAKFQAKQRAQRLPNDHITVISQLYNGVEEEKEKEEEEKEKHSTSAKRKSPPARPTRIEEDWIPSTYQLTYAKDQGMSEAQIRKAADNFRDYWLSTGKAMVSWDATWRRWVRTDLEKPTNGNHRSTGKPDFWKLAQEMRKEEAERGTR